MLGHKKETRNYMKKQAKLTRKDDEAFLQMVHSYIKLRPRLTAELIQTALEAQKEGFELDDYAVSCLRNVVCELIRRPAGKRGMRDYGLEYLRTAGFDLYEPEVMKIAEKRYAVDT